MTRRGAKKGAGGRFVPQRNYHWGGRWFSSQQEMATFLGVSTNTISNHLRRYGHTDFIKSQQGPALKVNAELEREVAMLEQKLARAQAQIERLQVALRHKQAREALLKEEQERLPKHGPAAQVLLFLRRYIAEHRQAPTVQEITEACQISSKSQTMRFIQKLEAQGFIERRGSRHRNIVLMYPDTQEAA